MLKSRYLSILFVFGTVFALIGVSALANVSPSYAADEIYVAPSNAPTVHPLGELRGNSITPATPQSAAPDSGDSDVLQPIQSGNITYVTGGIGDEERNALQSVKNSYNLHVMSATKDGAFAGDTRVIILDHNSGELVNTEAGPLFLAKLPDGKYTVQASHGENTKSQKVTISHGKTSHVHFSW